MYDIRGARSKKVLIISFILMVSMISIPGYAQVCCSGFDALMPVDVLDVRIPGGPTEHVNVHIIKPVSKSERLPVIMYFHGGGWMGGDKDTHGMLIRKLANKADAAIVFVEYSLCPKVKYPVPVEEAYHAMKYIADHGERLGLDPSRLAVAGDSAGGNMAAVMAIMAKQRNGPKILYQVLFYPVTDARFDTPSYKEFASGYQLDRETMKHIWECYLPDMKKGKEPMASPLQASVDMLKGLPPALVITAEKDVLRDEGEAYARKLAEAGVPVTGKQFIGTLHGFILRDGLDDTQATQDAIDLAGKTLYRAFWG